MALRNEVRIGNWINILYADGKTQTSKIDMISKEGGFGFDEEDGWSMYVPIELTEEILEKCGFEPCSDDGLWNYIGMQSFTLQNRYLSGDGFDAKLFNEDIMPFIKSLHQLQNLYFALTNEELNYKP